MNLIDIIVVISCALVVVFSVVFSIINKKKGKTTCGCDCSKCVGCKNNAKKNKT